MTQETSDAAIVLAETEEWVVAGTVMGLVYAIRREAWDTVRPLLGPRLTVTPGLTVQRTTVDTVVVPGRSLDLERYRFPYAGLSVRAVYYRSWRTWYTDGLARPYTPPLDTGL